MEQVNLVAGIRQAVSRGDTLEQAMMSFFNAGFPRTDIENAARTVQAEQAGIAQPVRASDSQTVGQSEAQKPETRNQKPVESPPVVPSVPEVSKETKPLPEQKPIDGVTLKQKISSYGDIAKEVIKAEHAEGVKKSGIGDQASGVGIQKVSDYGEKKNPPKKMGKILIFILIFILVVLAGFIASVVIFKEKFISIFSNMFI